jgi:hypothetical protein
VQPSQEGFPSSWLWIYLFQIRLQEAISCITFTTIIIYLRNLEYNTTQRTSISNHWYHAEPPNGIAPSTIILPLTNAIFSTLVMSLLLLLPSLQGTAWLLLPMADSSIGWTDENRKLGSVEATIQLRQLQELLGGSISSTRTESRKSSSMLLQLLCVYIIARSLLV